jgi:hypothetical protein
MREATNADERPVARGPLERRDWIAVKNGKGAASGADVDSFLLEGDLYAIESET